MILQCPYFYESDFSVVGDDIYISQPNGFIANTYTQSNTLGHSVLSKGFAPAFAKITANFNFIFQLASSQVGYSSVIYELIDTSGNDIVNPNDWIRFKLTATKQNTGSISAYNPLAIDIQLITKNFGIIYTFPRYYCNYASFQDVAIIFELSNISGGKCNINIQYVDNHRWKSFSRWIYSFTVSSSYQWHMQFNPELISVYQQNNYLLMNVSTPLILPSVASSLTIGSMILTQLPLNDVELPSIASQLEINSFYLSALINSIILPSIDSSLDISGFEITRQELYNTNANKKLQQDLSDFYINTNFDLELTKDERDVKTDNTLITSILITLGSNLSITQEEKNLYNVDTRDGWYAETLFNYPVGWKGWLIPHLKTNQLSQIKKWLLEGFQWLIDDKIIQKLDVLIQKIDNENYYFQLKFYKKNESENYRFVYNWEKKNLELR
jgi:phage gp46-like protein